MLGLRVVFIILILYTLILLETLPGDTFNVLKGYLLVFVVGLIVAFGEWLKGKDC